MDVGNDIYTQFAYWNGSTKLADAIVWNKSVKLYSNLESVLSKCIKFQFHTVVDCDSKVNMPI